MHSLPMLFSPAGTGGQGRGFLELEIKRREGSPEQGSIVRILGDCEGEVRHVLFGGVLFFWLLESR